MNEQIPFQVAKTAEQQQSWEGISTPYDLAIFLSRIMSVDMSKASALQEIIYSNLEPDGDDASKIWIKTDAPVGIGIPTSDGYHIIYQTPPNIPFLFLGKDADIPPYFRKLTSTEITQCGLTDTDEQNAFWLIFTP